MAGVHVVTGASGGIGREIARGLAAHGARVVLACRDAGRAEAARRYVAAAGGPAPVVAIIDLASRSSIRREGEALVRQFAQIDVLVNNAAIAPARRTESDDGLELTWATNVLGYFLLTEALMPSLRRAPAARVINVASRMAYDLDLGDVQFTRRPYSASGAYAQSKQADRMLTWALANRLTGGTITANALHPGTVDTRLLHALAPGMRGMTPAEGADTAVWLATADAVTGVSGKFFQGRREIPCEFRGPATDALWDLCVQMTRA